MVPHFLAPPELGAGGRSGVFMPHSASILDITYSPLLYAWLIPLFPLVGFLINGVLGPLTGKPLPNWLPARLVREAC